MTDRFLSRTVAALLAVAAAAGALLAFAQNPFASSRFEYGESREYVGRIEWWPFPVLLTGSSRFLLVAPGKHGLDGAPAGAVRLKGALIQRGTDAMLEVLPGSMQPSAGSRQSPREAIAELGSYTLTGEIVDSKCFFGVMNPGNGKVHRDCAVRCISGGIPPAFLVNDRSGESRVLLLAGAGGRPLGREILDYVAEPVSARGRLLRRGSAYTFEIDLRTLRRE